MALHKINDYLQHTLREDFTSPNPEVRKAAIYALGRLGSGPDVLLVLKNIAAEDEDPEVRYTAKKALNYWEGVLSEDAGEPERVEVRRPDGGLDVERFAGALASPRSGYQIAATVEAVKLGDPAALPPLRGMLEREQDPWVVSIAVKALGSLGGPEDVPRLTPFLEDSNHRVVANTIEALEMVSDPEIVAHVGSFLESPDNRVRANAVKAVFPRDPDLALRTLETMAINHRPWMRASAIYCLKVLDDPRCEGLLLEMARKEYAEDLTRQLLDAIVAQGSRSSVGVLAALAEEAEEGERKQQLETATQVLARKLEVDMEEIQALARAQRQRDQAERGQRSGMYRMEDVELGEDEPPEHRPATAPRALPREAVGGYGADSAPARPPEDDPGWRLALGLALALAAMAALFALTRGRDPASSPRPPAATDGIR